MNQPKTVKFQARNGKTAQCGKCSTPIAKGDRYTFVYHGFRGAKLVRCTSYACAFKRSEYTASKMAGVYAASEEGHNRIDELKATDLDSVEDDLAQILSEVADGWREVASEYEEAADNMGEGFGDQMTEKAEQINDAADELENASPSVDSAEACAEHDAITAGCDDCDANVQAVLDEAREEARMAIDDAESQVG